MHDSGTITHEGVTSTSNSMSADQMRESLGITETPEAAPETPAASGPPDASASPAAEPLQKKVDPTKDPERRISKATWEREEARREAARERESREKIEREYQDYKAKHEKPEPSTPAEPTFDELLEKHKNAADPYAAAIREQARNDVKAEIAARETAALESRQQQELEQRHQTRQQNEQARLAEFGNKLSAALTANPDLEQQMATANMDISRPMADAIMESDDPGKLIAHLLSNPDINAQILALPSGLKQFRALARLDATLESPAQPGSGSPVKKTAAHAPISPVGGGHAAPSSGPPDPKTCTQEEFDAYYNAEERQSRSSGRR